MHQPAKIPCLCRVVHVSIRTWTFGRYRLRRRGDGRRQPTATYGNLRQHGNREATALQQPTQESNRGVLEENGEAALVSEVDFSVEVASGVWMCHLLQLGADESIITHSLQYNTVQDDSKGCIHNSRCPTKAICILTQTSGTNTIIYNKAILISQ